MERGAPHAHDGGDAHDGDVHDDSGDGDGDGDGDDDDVPPQSLPAPPLAESAGTGRTWDTAFGNEGAYMSDGGDACDRVHAHAHRALHDRVHAHALDL